MFPRTGLGQQIPSGLQRPPTFSPTLWGGTPYSKLFCDPHQQLDFQSSYPYSQEKAWGRQNKFALLLKHQP